MIRISVKSFASVFITFLLSIGIFHAEHAGHIPKAEEEIRIDGVIQETAWEKGLIISKFYEVEPGDNAEPPVETIAYVTYDQENFYLALRCYDPEPEKIRARYADRDQVWADDYVVLVLDPFNDQRYAFEFLSNPLGAQADLTMREQQGEDSSWDGIWKSAGRITSEGYEVEIAIPFKSLRFPNVDMQTWRFVIMRTYPRKFRHQISSVPFDRSRDCLLCQAATYTGMEGVKPGRNIEIVPSLVGTQTKLKDEDSNFDSDAGISTAWGITPNLTLNATANPDFSQIEADALQIDVNTRFALFYPEKRPFFLEGQDYFTAFFDTLYTRTIADPSWGLKFTGKEGRNACGVLVAQDEIANFLIPSNEGSDLFTWDHEVLATAMRYRRDIGKDSTVGALFMDRQGGDYRSSLYGVDGHIRIARSDFFDFQFIDSRTTYPLLPDVSEYFDGSEKSGKAIFIGTKHSSRHWEYSLWYESKDPAYRADLGFVPRADTIEYGFLTDYVFYGDGNRFFSKLRPLVYFNRTTDQLHTTTDVEGGAELYFELPKQTNGEVGFEKTKELYRGIEYEKNNPYFWVNSRFCKAMTAYMRFEGGDRIDYVNQRPARGEDLKIQFDVRFGKRLFLDANASQQRLRIDEGRVFKASVYFMKWIYHFNNNLYIRATLQLQDIRRNLDLYSVPVDVFGIKSFERYYTNQFLFTYKINPFTLLYLGYSDTGIEDESIDRTTLSTTYFLKLSYAFRP